MISADRAEELIERRRRQLHVHSIIYYHMHTNLIDDATFDLWSKQLVSLQHDFPQFLHKGYMHTVFSNWTGDTGMHLPVSEDAYNIAQGLLRTAEQRNHVVAQAPKIERWEGDVGYVVN